jgi:hypothetical protein
MFVEMQSRLAAMWLISIRSGRQQCNGDPALIRIIIRSKLFQRHQDDEKNAHPHTHRCGSYPEDQVLRHCLLPAHLTQP